MAIKNAYLSINKALNAFKSNMDASDMIFKKSTKHIRDSIDEVGKMADNAISNLPKDANFKSARSGIRGQQERLTKGLLDEERSILTGSVIDALGQYYSNGGSTKDLAKGYFGIGKENTLTSGQRKARYGTVMGIGGAGIGASMYSRYKKGGSLTRNEKGEKDIAGLPFI